MKEAVVATVVGAVNADAVKKAFTAADVNADTFLEPNELSKFLASMQGGANAPSFLQVEEHYCSAWSRRTKRMRRKSRSRRQCWQMQMRMASFQCRKLWTRAEKTSRLSERPVRQR